MIIDTHAHYDDEQFDADREELLGSMEEGGIGLIVNVGSTVASWDKIVELTERYPFIYGAIGVHPDEVGELDEEKFLRMADLLELDKIVAVGEIGLDYYWDKEKHDLQKEWFVRQLDLAREKELPVIIHSREAAADTFDIMKRRAAGMKAVIHCYSSDTFDIMKRRAAGMKAVIHCYSYSTEMAREYVKMGYYIGVGGVVTFKNAKKLKQVVQEIPLESIVLETDCPYLAPVPYRGKRNCSLYLPYVAEQIAELKGTTVEEVIQQTEKNSRELYGL